MSRATIAHSLGDIIISAIANKVITISSSSIIWPLPMVQHLKGYCWLWTMLLPNGHYSVDLKKVSTMTLPFQASKLARDALWSNRGQLCIVSPVQEKTNPKKGHQILSEDNMGHLHFSFDQLDLLVQTLTRAKGLSPSSRDWLSLSADWFLWDRAAADLKKSPWALKGSWKPGHEQTLDRHTNTAQLFPFLWNPISANLHSNEMSSDKLQSKAIKSQRVWAIGFSEIRLVMQWRLGQMVYHGIVFLLLSKVRYCWLNYWFVVQMLGPNHDDDDEVRL